MKLPASTKTSSFGRRPHIKKGYYPAKLLKVEPYKDKDGNLKEGKYGRQSIFEFAIYNADPKTNAPTTQMDFVPDPANKEAKADVVISKFVYHEYKDRKTGEFQTAITPNSAITKLLKSLGWEFSADGVDTDELIGNWVEVNVDDFEYKYNDETMVASTVKDVGPYKGPEVKSDANQASHHNHIDSKTEKELLNKMEELKKLNNKGLLSDNGLKMGLESLETQLKGLK